MDEGEGYEESDATLGMASSYTPSGAEVEYHRQVFGVTYRERHGPEHDKCVVYCLEPGQKLKARCPKCYGPARLAPIADAPDFDPGPGRMARLARWFGVLLGELALGLAWPFRHSRAHHEALIRDILQDAIGRGLAAEVVSICPECEQKEAENAVRYTAEVVPGPRQGGPLAARTETVSETKGDR